MNLDERPIRDKRQEEKTKRLGATILEQEILHVDGLARRHLGHEDGNMFFEDAQIADAILDELRADQLARVVPLLMVGAEDA